MSGFVYAIECEDAVKIGWAANPVRRLSELNVGSHRTHRLLGFARGTKAHEAELHHLCDVQRIRGEWFRKGGVVNLFLDRLPEPPKITPPQRGQYRPRRKFRLSGFCQYMTDHNITDPKMAEMVGCSIGAIRKWRNGDRFPRHPISHQNQTGHRGGRCVPTTFSQPRRSCRELAIAKAMGVTPKIDLDSAEFALETARKALGR